LGSDGRAARLWGMRPEGLPAVPIPTTSVTASVIAAIQCQEAVKILHGLGTLGGAAWCSMALPTTLIRFGSTSAMPATATRRWIGWFRWGVLPRT